MNLNKLIVTLFAMDGEDLSVKSSKLRNNIRQGREVDPVGDIPDEYRPDFAALHKEAESMGRTFSAAWAAFERARRARYDLLVDRWQAKDYAGMVAVMDAPVPETDGE